MFEFKGKAQRTSNAIPLAFDWRNLVLVLEFLFCGVAANLAIGLHYLFDNDIKQTGSSSNGLHVLQKCNVIPKQK